MLKQLTAGATAHFPVIMTKKYACDKAVVSLLRSCTLGNSPTALRNTLLELHSEEWMKKQLVFLEDCERHKRGLAAMGAVPVQYKEALPFSAFPTPRLVKFENKQTNKQTNNNNKQTNKQQETSAYLYNYTGGS